MTTTTMSQQGSSRLSTQGDLGPGNYPSGLLLERYSQQQRMQAALQRDSLADNPRSENLLAAAVQQQLVASLANPSLHRFPLGTTTPLTSDLADAILSRPGPSVSLFHPSLLGTSGRGYPAFPSTQKGVRQMDSSSGPRVTTCQIPCQARGMSTDHNSLTAYFEIPSDASHGQHLYCSHPTCRASGVKFRYCLYCKKPVTKQNFRSRHLHADEDKATDAPKSPVGGKKRKLEEGGSTEKTGARQRVIEPERTTSSSPANSSDEEHPLVCPEISKTQNDSKTVHQSLSQGSRWSELLHERPKGLNNVDAWIKKVIEVAKASPRDGEPEKAAPDTGSTQQVTRWNELLKERPPGDEACASATTWLMKVLEVSCACVGDSR